MVFIHYPQLIAKLCKDKLKKADIANFEKLFKNLGDNIDVDSTFKCHAERSRSIYFKRGLRSFTFVQDDKFAKKNELRVNCYIVTKI